jgi:hydroxyacylglutathione hydrolase
VVSRSRLTELEPALVISTHGYPVSDMDKWREGIRTVPH